MKISEAQATNEMARLAKEIARHNRLCRTKDATEISNSQYEGLVLRHSELEATFPHLARAKSALKVLAKVPDRVPLEGDEWKAEH